MPRSPSSKISSKDDTYIKKNLAKEFKGKFYSADYFDYELMMQKFKEFYQAEMKAFENYKQKEKENLRNGRKPKEAIGEKSRCTCRRNNVLGRTIVIFVLCRDFLYHKKGKGSRRCFSVRAGTRTS
jgi:hypothetical protein